MDLKNFYESEFAEHQDVLLRTLNEVYDSFEKLVNLSVSSLEKGGKILFFGNGGSASDAQHLATELTVRYKTDRKALAAISLATDTSALTAIGNDYSFDEIFSRQIEAIGKPEDIAIGITTSGKSPNIMNAFKMAKKIGMATGSLSGKGGGDLVGFIDPLVLVPSHTTARVQEMHIMLGQMLCNAIEYKLGLVD